MPVIDNARPFILAASALALLAPSVSAATLDQFTFGTGPTSVLTPTTIGEGISASSISADAGVTLDLSNSQSNPPATPWLRVSPVGANPTAAAAVTANADFKFSLSIVPGFTMTLSTLTFGVMNGGSGTRGYAVQSSVDNFGSIISTANVTTVRPNFTPVSVDLSGATYQNLSSITFKLFSYSAAAGSSVEYDNITVNGTATFNGYEWQGGSSNSWDTTSTNWTGAGTTYVDNTTTSNVWFGDAGTTGTVNVAAGGLSPNLLTLTNSTARDYTFSGGNLNVATSLFKSGNGTATFNNNVTAGSVTADTGTLTVGATGTLTSPSITVSPTGLLTVASGGALGATSGLTVNGPLTLNNANQKVATLNGATTGLVTLNGVDGITGTVLEVTGTSTYAGKISGPGSLVKSTGGVLTLSGTSNYTGGTTITGGTLQLSSVAAAGTGTVEVKNGGNLSLGAAVANAITLSGGTLGVSGGVTTPANVTVTAPSTINTFNPATGATGNDLVITGMLLGSGDLNVVSINGTSPDNKAFRLQGTSSDYSGAITVAQSAKLELQTSVGSGSPMGTGKLVVTGGTTTTGANGTFSIVNIRNNYTGGDTTFGNNVEVAGTGASYFNMVGSAPTGSVANFGDLKIGAGQSIATVSTGTSVFTLAFASVHLTGNATFTPQPFGNTNYKSVENISLGAITENVPGAGITMNGAATLTLTGNNTYTGATTVSSGTLKVSGSIAGSSQITVQNSGSVVLAGTSADRIGNNAALSLGSAGAGSPATLQIDNSVGQITETVGALTLANNSILDLGTGSAGSVFRFADSSPQSWTPGATLSIYNWSSGTDHLFFGDGTTTGLLGSQLNSITFYAGGAGSQALGSAMFVSGGELAPVPEPTTLASGLVMLGYVFFHRRRAGRWTNMGRRDS
ncbi:beta strand repeat-containing protein [Verrucomicrobiota bacterium sgz303538]